jgi:hypothetical protein
MEQFIANSQCFSLDAKEEDFNIHVFSTPYCDIRVCGELAVVMRPYLTDERTDRADSIIEALDLLSSVSYELGFGGDINQLFE